MVGHLVAVDLVPDPVTDRGLGPGTGLDLLHLVAETGKPAVLQPGQCRLQQGAGGLTGHQVDHLGGHGQSTDWAEGAETALGADWAEGADWAVGAEYAEGAESTV